MLRIFKIFLRTEGTNPILVLSCLFAASLCEAASLSALVPAAAALSGDAPATNSAVANFMHGLLASIGLVPALGNLVLLVAVAMVLKSALSFAALSYAGASAARLAMMFRRRLISAVFKSRWSSFANRQGGHFAHTISSDAGGAGEAYLQSAQVVAFSFQVVAYVAVAFAINWRLALLGVAASGLLSILARLLIRRARKLGRKQTELTRSLTTYMVDMLTNIKPLKSMHRYQALLGDLNGIMHKLSKALVRKELTRVGLSQGSDAMIVVFAAAALYFASAFWQVSLAEMVVSGVVFLQVISVVSKLQRMLQNAVILQASYSNTLSLVSEVEASRELWGGTVAPDPAAGCRFDSVSFAYGDRLVIENASLDVPAQSITVFMGPSGAGKTTLIDLLIGFHRPLAGNVLIAGTPLSEIDIEAWRKMIGYVPQDLSLFHASIRENITLGDDSIADETILDALAQAGAQDFVHSLPEGLDTDVGEMGGKLSGGQRQRISLARALVTRPKVLILDEVTSALDPETEAEIVENISKLRGAYTTIAITHRPAWTQIADRLYEVSGGRVTAVRTKHIDTKV